MCGIFALLNNDNQFDEQFLKEQFEKGKGRGPEFSTLTKIMIKADFGFHRLAINGLNSESNQPIIIGDIALICNGEIYNYRDLYEMMDIDPTTDSDCEVILHLYREYGIEQTLQMLDGVFAFVLIDYRMTNEQAKIYVARDPYGVRPLYALKPLNANNENIVGFASELKGLNKFYQEMNKTEEKYSLNHFEPGTYAVYELPTKVSPQWVLKTERRYHSTGFTSIIHSHLCDTTKIIENIQYYLTTAVEKRCSTTERPIACLLSGGLDSSLITALVVEYHKLFNHNFTIETYSIGLEGSEDLKYAKIVADYLGTKHTEIIVTECDFKNAIPHVVKSIESYDTTTVRASLGNWLLGKYIAEHSEAKVIFNGDGSDELTGGYLYMHKAPDMIEFDGECRRLLKDIHMFDVLRSDKSISSHGLEPRTPFLDRTWVQYYLSIPLHIRYHPNEDNCEKYLLRTAFSYEHFKNREGDSLLPDEILWRRKEAFSDGVSKQTRSLYEIIQEYTYEKMHHENYKVRIFMTNLKDHLLPMTSEQQYYRCIFEEEYKGLGKVVPYFWMPKYVEAKDASARTLDIYSKTEPSKDCCC